MPETGSQILSYQGQSGLGSNASIPAINPKADLDVINQIGRDILMINHDNNIRLYQQKVRDRDDTLQMIADGQVSAGKIDPSDRKYYDEAKKKATDDFYEMIKNGGLNNPDAVRKYRESVTDLKNVATWAQHREIGLTALETEKAAQTLPKDIAMYDNHIRKMRSQPFWNQVNPLQKAFKYDINSSIAKVTGQPIIESEIGTMSGATSPMGVTQWNSVTDRNGVITQKQTTKTSPLRNAQITAPKGKGVSTTGTQVNPDGTLSEISYTPEKYWDLETIQQNVSELSASNPEDNYTYHEWLNDVETKLPEDRKLALLIADNNRIAEYSRARGIQPNPDGTYPDQVKFFTDPISKRTHINETPESFFAKHSLASIKGNYVEEGQRVFNDKIAGYKLDLRKQAEIERHNKATEGVDWAKYDLDKNKFIETTKGGEESKNAALAFAQGLFGDLLSKASRKATDGTVVLTNNDIRKLTADQLKFLGKELPAQRDQYGTVIESGGLQPLELNDNEVMQVSPDGTVLIMKDVKYNSKTGVYYGKWDNTRSTSVFNAARNVLNEENVKSGTKERNAYQPIDMRGINGNIQIDISGGSKTTSGSSQSKQSRRGKDGKTYTSTDGITWIAPDGTTVKINK